jgi:FkbM family methyltransferase
MSHEALRIPIKRFIRRSLWKLGWDLRRFNLAESKWSQLIFQLKAHDINTVIDIGANIGQFAESLRDAGFQGRIISFEASQEAHHQLQRRAQHDNHWTVAPRLAVGAENGKTTINISCNSVSSSVLPMLSAHLTAEPKSAYVRTETVELRKLDSIADDCLSDVDCVFLKSDAQGFESEVLRGARRLLDRVAGLQMELSLIPLYEGEHLFEFMLHEIQDRGFELWSLVPGFVDKNTGRLLQVDGTFFRR